MKRFLLGTVAAIAFAVPAVAADLAARPYTKAPPMIAAVYAWSGFYIGANGGWGSSRNCWDAVTFTAFEGCHDASGGTAGGQIGYRWQAGTWVFGVEGQGNWANFSGSNVNLAFPLTTINSKIDAFGLMTAQIGYAANNALFYLKGGAAVVAARYRVNTNPGNVLVASSNDDIRWGGVVGVGLEYGFAPNWSAAIEYDHLFMQDRTVGFSFAGGGFPKLVRQDVDLVTVRVNYRWGGPAIATY